jgi:hypothetical protein
MIGAGGHLDSDGPRSAIPGNAQDRIARRQPCFGFNGRTGWFGRGRFETRAAGSAVQRRPELQRREFG